MNKKMDNVISLSARKNISGLSDEDERLLYDLALDAWEKMCLAKGYSYEPVGDFVVLPSGETEFEIQLKNVHGDVAYFKTRGGTSGTLRFIGREVQEE